MASRPAALRRIVGISAALAGSLLSCGREPTAPGGAPAGAVRYSQGLSWIAQWPSGVQQFQAAGGSGVAFTKVRVVLTNADGSIALDTLITFTPGADEMTVTLNVPLPAGASASGVPLTLNLDYQDASGASVFHGGPVTVNAVPAVPGAGPPPPSPVTIPITYTGPGSQATQVRISPKTLTVNTGGAFQFSAQALDASGVVVPNTPIVFSSDNTIFAQVNAATGAGTAGSARGAVGIQAKLFNGTSDAATLTIVSPAAALAVVSGAGQTGPVNATLPSPVVVRVTATDGGPAAGVAVSFAAGSGGSVGTASATTDASGNAQTTWRLGNTVGAQTMTVTSAGLSGSPVTVSATARAVDPVRVVFAVQPPASTAAGVTLAPAIVVNAVDGSGAVTTGFTGPVTLALGAGAPAGATLSGTATVNAVAGVATFADLKLSVPGTYTFVASASSLLGATSSSFAIVAGTANKLVFQGYPVAGAAAGSVLDPVTVLVRDALGNAVSTFTGPVTLTLSAAVAAATNAGSASNASNVSASGDGGVERADSSRIANAVITGTTTVNAVAGVATFTGLSLTTAGSFALTATSPGLTAATGPVFAVTPGAASTLVLVSGGGQSAAGAAVLASPIVVGVTDGFGNGIAGVTVTFAPAAGTVSPTSAVTDGAGQAQASWTLGGAAGAQTLNVSGPGLSPNPLAVSATATAAAGGTVTQLLFTAQPTNAVAGVAISPSIVVTAKDALGAVVTGFAGNVSLAITTNPGGGTLAGTTTVAAVAGVATFPGLSINKAGAGYIVSATTGAVTNPSATFNITAAAASAIVADSGNGQTGVISAALTQKIVARVTDVFGNGVAGASVTMAIATGAGTLSPTGTQTTDVNGRVRTTWTLGPGTGTQTVTATGGAIATTLYVQHFDSLFSLGDTLTRVPVSRDGAGTIVTGSITYVSRNAAFVTVNGTGLMTAIANGSTYVVATEAGGTKDSTLVTVQQRVATVNVTPGNRNIYKTRTFTFTASAVDGRGNVVPGAPAITWTTVTPSVATVDAAGLVTGVSLGSTQLRAASGAIVGVATVAILTPITRIIVGRDSSGVPVTDTTALASLGIRRTMRAQARDTLDAPMTGVTFTWSSTNGSVALIDTAYAQTAAVLSNANGTTTIQATADGIVGSTALKVQQILSSIELTPTPDTIGVTGTVQVTARGKDANARYISGGSFTYSSNATGIATVNATTGVVTGVALGSANITATSGAITSNVALIVVASTVPAAISFGRDTLTVGRGANVSIPVFLSRPNGSNVTVNLAARDTNAYFSVGSITFTPGQTALNVTLNGRNAGTTQIYALESTANGYKGDTAAVAVQANMRFSTSGWSLNSTDQVAAQVLLSDPSPAGGTFVTFNYGTAGRAQVSPDPAFIPAGQLASNVVITALGSTTGSTTITPIAAGVNGTAATLTVYAPKLQMNLATARLGAGQYESNDYVQVSAYTNVAIPLTFTSSDTNVVTVTPSATIPSGSYYAYYTVTAKAPGTATVIVSAAGWLPDTLYQTVTSPRVRICCATNLVTTSPIQNAYVYPTDSLYSQHYRTSSLALTVSSSDTSVIQVLDKTPTIAAGQNIVFNIRYQPGGSGGSAYIKVTAGGHAPDSVLVTVVGPKLQLSWCCTNLLGTGQYEPNVYVTTPTYLTAPLTVTLASSNALKATVSASATVPTSSYYAYFTVTGVDTGLVSIIATAPGYQPDTAFYRVSSPRLYTSGGTTLNNFGPGASFYVDVRDSLGGCCHLRSAPLVVTLTSTNPAVVTIDSSSVRIAAGAYYNNSARVSAVGNGTAYIVASAAGHRIDSTLYTVQTPKLSFSWVSANLGRRQRHGTSDLYVTTPDYRPSALAVTITQKQPGVDSLAATALTIPTSGYYSYIQAHGLALGVDTLIASAPGYLPDTAFIRVTTPRLYYGGGLPSNATTTSPPSTLYVYATDSVNSSHYVMDSVTVHAVSSDTTVIKPAQAYFRIPRGQYYSATTVNYFGPGTANITFSDSAGSGYVATTSNTVTVTGPSLVFNSTSAMYGMRQHGNSGDYYVYTQNNVASPLIVNLVSTDTRVATVPASVTIPAGSYYAYFTITAQDTVGTIQVQATASGYGPPTPINVQVTVPKFVVYATTNQRTTSGPQTITVQVTDANGSAHWTNEAVTVNFASSSVAVFTVDSASVTIPANAYYNNSARTLPVGVGAAQLTASDARAAIYKYTSGSANISVVNPNLSFSWNSTVLGLGQYVDSNYDGSYYVTTSDYQASALTVALSHVGTTRASTPATVTVPTSSYYQYFRITGAARGTDTLVASAASPFHNPDTAYVAVDSGRVDNIVSWPTGSLAVGDSVAVTLRTWDPNLSAIRRVAAATTFTLAPNSKIEFRQGGAVVTSVTVPIDGTQVSFYVKAIASGSGTAVITNTNYKTYSPPAITIP